MSKSKDGIFAVEVKHNNGSVIHYKAGSHMSRTQVARFLNKQGFQVIPGDAEGTFVKTVVPDVVKHARIYFMSDISRLD